MYDVKITVKRITTYPDLIKEYENPIEHTCDLKEGLVFISNNGDKPIGLCDEAWKVMAEYVKAIADGVEDFFDGWMKNKATAMISCNDGFRPVSFYIERIDK